MKMHLGVRVPNEGARKLAWWIGRECYGSITLAAYKLGRTQELTLQRLLDGEITPGEPLARSVGEITGIHRLDWQRPAGGGWFDEPIVPGTLGKRAA